MNQFILFAGFILFSFYVYFQMKECGTIMTILKVYGSQTIF